MKLPNNLLTLSCLLSLSMVSHAAQDITQTILTKSDNNCASYADTYHSNVNDINRNTAFSGNLKITTEKNECILSSNLIPNHDFNDGEYSFPNNVSAQAVEYRITSTPTFADQISELSLRQDNALLLNGVKVDLLAAGCFGIGNGRIGCNDINQAWRYDPMHAANGFRVDSHNAHSQPDGSYHYHGHPNALFDDTSVNAVIGFAADGFPILSSYFSRDNSTVRKATSSYRLKSGSRPNTQGQPGGIYDGTYRDDYEYVAGHGDLDECNGMMINGSYGYYVTDAYPYILTCFKGTPHESFNKRR